MFRTMTLPTWTCHSAIDEPGPFTCPWCCSHNIRKKLKNWLKIHCFFCRGTGITEFTLSGVGRVVARNPDLPPVVVPLSMRVPPVLGQGSWAGWSPAPVACSQGSCVA